MKFLVSPGFRHPSRIRNLLLSVLLFLFFFNGFHALSFVLESSASAAFRGHWQARNLEKNEEGGFEKQTAELEDADGAAMEFAEEENWPEKKAVEGAGGDVAQSKAIEKVRLAILEGLHIDLFVFSMQYLFLLSLFFQTEKKRYLQGLALHGFPVLFLLWLALRFFAPEAGLYWAIGTLAASLVFYACLQALVLRLLYKIFFSKK